MKKADNTVDDCELLLGNIEPKVETFNELAPDLFAWVGGDVGVWL
jgi:hypothetical protein